MKRIFTLALVAAGLLSASAKDVVVVKNGGIEPGFQYNEWWNATTTFYEPNPVSGGETVFTFKSTNGGAAASMGIMANTGTGPLHSATLTFDWYATQPGAQYTVRLTADSEENYTFTVADDQVNKWNTTSISVAETYPAVSKQWKEFKTKGSGFVFSIVGSNMPAESVLSIGSVIYKNVDETWVAPEVPTLPVPTTVPVPTLAPENVVSLLSGAYTPAAMIGIGGWGQATRVENIEINGAPVQKLVNFNYLGWELSQHVDVSSCHYLHVDFFPSEATGFGFTAISPGKEKAYKAENVVVGEWNSFDVPLTHWKNVDLTDIFQMKFNEGAKTEGYIANVYFYKDPNYIEPEKPKAGAVWNGTAQSALTLGATTYNVTAEYAITALEDGRFEMTLKPAGQEGIPGLAKLQLLNNAKYDDFTNNDGVYTVTSTNTYALGETLNELALWMPYTGGVLRINLDYTFGEAKAAVVAAAAPVFRTITVSDITSSSANLGYTVALPAELEGATVALKVNGNVIEGNPATVAGLAENTEHTLNVEAQATLGDVVYTSKPLSIKVKTLREDAVSLVWYGITDGTVTNAYLPGEDPATMRREIPITGKVTMTMNPDQTLTADIVFNCQLPVGCVPSVTLTKTGQSYNRVLMTKVDENHYTHTSTVKFTEGDLLTYLYFYLAYDGGNSGNQPAITGYKAGAVNDGCEYGTPASVVLNIPGGMYKVGDKVLTSAWIKDANKHFLLNEKAELSSNNTAVATVDGEYVTTLAKGDAQIKATCGKYSATAPIKCVVSDKGVNLYNDKCTVTSDLAKTTQAFDGKLDTFITWACKETEDHYLTVTFDSPVEVEAVEAAWEGACAQDYTLTFAPVESKAREASPVEFAMTGVKGGSGMTIRNSFYNPDYSGILTNAITLHTTKAFNTTWGIKLKELTIMGQEYNETGITDIEADSTAEYYTLQGVRVANPTKGQLYIKRQGGKSVKVIM